MEIAFRKLSDERHRVTVERADGSLESVVLDTKDFLNHDLAHLAVEIELGIADGVWGSVARGGSLDGPGLDGAGMGQAESVAGPMQTMLRTEAPPEAILEVLERLAPDVSSEDLADRLFERLRSLRGHWAGTAYGQDMNLNWPE